MIGEDSHGYFNTGIVVFPVLIALSLETFIMKNKLFAVLLQTHEFTALSYILKSDLLSDLKTRNFHTESLPDSKNYEEKTHEFRAGLIFFLPTLGSKVHRALRQSSPFCKLLPGQRNDNVR
jgi:hypothetical protein